MHTWYEDFEDKKKRARTHGRPTQPFGVMARQSRAIMPRQKESEPFGARTASIPGMVCIALYPHSRSVSDSYDGLQIPSGKSAAGAAQRCYWDRQHGNASRGRWRPPSHLVRAHSTASARRCNSRQTLLFAGDSTTRDTFYHFLAALGAPQVAMHGFGRVLATIGVAWLRDCFG